MTKQIASTVLILLQLLSIPCASAADKDDDILAKILLDDEDVSSEEFNEKTHDDEQPLSYFQKVWKLWEQRSRFQKTVITAATAITLIAGVSIAYLKITKKPKQKKPDDNGNADQVMENHEPVTLEHVQQVLKEHKYMFDYVDETKKAIFDISYALLNNNNQKTLVENINVINAPIFRKVKNLQNELDKTFETEGLESLHAELSDLQNLHKI